MPADGRRTASYRQILDSSALVGSAGAIVLLVGLVRAKAMAMMLGPAGFGLMGAFTALADLMHSIASMGINSGGVRQIAESAAASDEQRVARTAIVLRRTALILGLCAFGAMTLGARRLATATFGDAGYAPAVAVLGVAVMLRILSDGQGALLQGLRRISEMARASVLGAVLGTVAALASVWQFRHDGVAVALVAAAASSALCSWRYSRKVRLTTTILSRAQWSDEMRGLLSLGMAFMFSAVVMMGVAYAVRLVLVRSHSLEAAGLFTAAWTVGGLYVGFILQAMGADFYPRLVGLAADDAATNQLVNEQTHVGLLLAAAGVLGTLSLAPWLLALFYSAEFVEAGSVLQWVCLGMALRVVTWPMGYVVIARSRRRVFVQVELAWAAANLSLTWFAVQAWGTNGAGIAFFGSYVFHACVLYPIVRRMTGFRLWRSNIVLAAAVFVTCGAVKLAYAFLPELSALAVGCAATLAAMVLCIARLSHLAGASALPPRFQRAVAAMVAADSLLRRRVRK